MVIVGDHLSPVFNENVLEIGDSTEVLQNQYMIDHNNGDDDEDDDAELQLDAW